MQPKVENVEIPLPNLQESFSAVQISDLHIGGLIEENVVRGIVKQVNTLKPDVIFLTGDIIDTEVSKCKKQCKNSPNFKHLLAYFL